MILEAFIAMIILSTILIGTGILLAINYLFCVIFNGLFGTNYKWWRLW